MQANIKQNPLPHSESAKSLVRIEFLNGTVISVDEGDNGVGR